jgi:indolepyruvate ferredoxin oxidoreductase
MDVPAMTRALDAEGAARIVVCAEDPKRYGRRAGWAPGVRVLGRDRLPEVQEELRGVAGVSVIVYDQRCAAEARRLRKRGLLPEPPRRVVINESVCEGCGDCGTKSNCLSVLPQQTEFGERRRIHDPSCNRDYTCLEGDCPSFLTITPKAKRRWSRSRRKQEPVGDARRERPPLPSGPLPTPEQPEVHGRYGIYFTGIGGTGVVTASHLLAAAAEAAGFAIGGLDQTGLSQKAGAVVSHLLLTPASGQGSAGAATVGEGGADLYLSGDILQAAGPAHLAKVRVGRTLAVVDRRVTPTTGMLQSDLAPPEVPSLERAITAQTGPGRAGFLDAARIAEAVFADHLLGNIVLLGAAFQLGGLPMSSDDIEQALQRQGRAAADNREAFTWGRWAVHRLSAVEVALRSAEHGGDRGTAGAFEPSASARATASALLARRELSSSGPGPDLPTGLHDLLTRRTAQAIDYQDERRGERFLDLVMSAAVRDGADRDWELTRTVAESWFKLLTYKDEYEVARLHLGADHRRLARDLGIEGPYKVTYHLHPPTLRRLGMRRKLPLGKPYELAFRILRRMRRLRGTPFDPFGRDPDRRTERAVVEEYERLLGGAFEDGMPYPELVRLAGSVQSIKGYGPIKEAAVAAWRAEVAELRTQDAVAAGADA